MGVVVPSIFSSQKGPFDLYIATYELHKKMLLLNARPYISLSSKNSFIKHSRLVDIGLNHSKLSAIVLIL